MKKTIGLVLVLASLLITSCASKEKIALYEKFNSERKKEFDSEKRALPEEYEELEISNENDIKMYKICVYNAFDKVPDVETIWTEDGDYIVIDDSNRVKTIKEERENIIEYGRTLGFSNKTINNIVSSFDLYCKYKGNGMKDSDYFGGADSCIDWINLDSKSK
jgi:hypothetical protein